MIQQQQDDSQKYEDQFCILTMFVQQSENCDILVGKITLIPKIQVPPQSLHIKLVGLSIVTKYEQPSSVQITNNDRNNSEYNIATNQFDMKMNSFQEFSIHSTNRDPNKLTANFQQKIIKNQYRSELYRQDDQRKVECFLQGIQKVTQLEPKQIFETWQAIHYPFTFSLPANLPPNIDQVHFAGNKIQIKYQLIIKTVDKNKSMDVEAIFPLVIRQKKVEAQKKMSNNLEYYCFGAFFCKCLGIYHIQFENFILAPGKLRMYTRVFREGKPAQNVITQIIINFYGELKGVKKILLATKQVRLSENQYQMQEGQIILDYDAQLRTISNQLFTIRFWIEPKIKFGNKLWVFSKRQQSHDILL